MIIIYNKRNIVIFNKMNIDETEIESKELCKNLYKSNLITIQEYNNCIGKDDYVREMNFTDQHKYGLPASLTDISIFNKRVQIYSDNKNNDILFLSVSNEANLGLTNGIFKLDDNIFEIIKESDKAVIVKHISSNKYLSYSIPDNKLYLTDTSKINSLFGISSFIVNDIINYKLEILKLGESETGMFLGINDENELDIVNDDFYWNIDIVETIETPELDNGLDNYNLLKKQITEVTEQYSTVNDKITILKESVSYILNSVEEIFMKMKINQYNNNINISQQQLNRSREETIEYLKQNQIMELNGEIEILENEKQSLVEQFNILKADIEREIENIKKQSADIDQKNNEMLNEINKYNNTLMHNNIVINVDDYLHNDQINNLKLIKSQINNDVSNKFKNKKNRQNILFVSVIALLSLAIVVLFASKLLMIQKQ